MDPLIPQPESNESALTDQQQTAVDLWAEGNLTPDEIAEAVGYSSGRSVRRFMSTEKGKTGLLRAVSNETLASAAVALRTVVDLATTAKSEKVKLDAATRLLDALGWCLPGLQPVQPQENMGLSNGAKEQARPVQVNINLGSNVDVVTGSKAGDTLELKAQPEQNS